MLETKIQFDLIIIGGGPVGLYSAFYSGIRNMKVLLIESLSQVGGQTSLLYPKKYIFDIPGYRKILGENLIYELTQQATQFEGLLNISLEEIVQSIQKTGEYEDEIELISIKTNKNKYITKSVLISIGAGYFIPRKPNIKDIEIYENKGLLYFIKDPIIFKNKNIAIAGGGDSAFSWAINLKKIAKKIYIINRSDRYRALEYFIEEAYNSKNIEILPFYEVESIEKEKELKELKSITLKHSKKDEKKKSI